MKRSVSPLAAIGGLVLSGLVLAACEAPEEESGTVTEVVLLDGTSLDHFDRVGEAEWVLADGYVESQGEARGFLVSKESFGDFRLTAEFWASDKANSGIFIRCGDVGNINPDTCYEVNIYDRRPDPAYRTGGIVHVAKPKMTMNAADRWNSFEILAVGDRLEVRMNGELLSEARDDRLASGHIALQQGGGTIRFRNIRIDPPPEAAPGDSGE